MDQVKSKMDKFLNQISNQKALANVPDHKEVQALFNSGLNSNDSCNDGVTFFQRAMQVSDVKVIEIFLKAGADVNSVFDEKSQNETTPLEIAAQRGDSDIFQLILDANIDIIKNLKARDILVEQKMKALGKITERLCTPARAYGLSEGSDGKAYREKNEAEFHKVKECYDAMIHAFDLVYKKKIDQINTTTLAKNH